LNCATRTPFTVASLTATLLFFTAFFTPATSMTSRAGFASWNALYDVAPSVVMRTCRESPLPVVSIALTNLAFCAGTGARDSACGATYAGSEIVSTCAAACCSTTGEATSATAAVSWTGTFTTSELSVGET